MSDWLVHQASVDDDTGMVAFTFKAGIYLLAGQVRSVEEYHAHLALFQRLADVTLPAPGGVPWAEEVQA